MKKNKLRKKIIKQKVREINLSLEQQNEINTLKNQLKQLLDFAEKSEERLQDLEIHVNLLTRLLTTLCIEKFGMRIGVLKRVIKRIEKEAIRDSQIMQLESLYQLSPKKKPKPNQPPSADPWEEIS